MHFTITDLNGVHGTMVQFCECAGNRDHVIQLMGEDLYPQTLEDPRSAFSYAVLKDHYLHSMQGKVSDQDYVIALRRKTDNVFTSDVPVCHSNYVAMSTDWILGRV
jgi:hypothetical protein